MKSKISKRYDIIRIFFSSASIKTYFLLLKSLVKKKLLLRKFPLSASIAITSSCNFSCRHCCVAQRTDHSKKELSSDEIKSLISQMVESGIVRIAFFGGEPTLRKDLPELVRYSSEKGIITTLETNGYLLDKMMITLKNAGISVITISLDSSKRDLHDKFRGCKGSFDKVIKAIKDCKKNGIKCTVSTYATNENIADGDMKSLIELSLSLGADAVRIISPLQAGRWKDNKDVHLTKENMKILKLLSASYQKVYLEGACFSSGKWGCDALAMNFIYVSPYGDVAPCFVLNSSFGNIRNEHFSKIISRMYRSSFFKQQDKHKCLGSERSKIEEFERNFPVKS